MAREILQGCERPFIFMKEPGFRARLQEYQNTDKPSNEAIQANRQTETLKRLELNESSTAEKVRTKAIELRFKFQFLLKDGGQGGLENLAHDLLFALSGTGDVKNVDELSRFLLFGWSYKEISIFREVKLKE